MQGNHHFDKIKRRITLFMSLKKRTKKLNRNHYVKMKRLCKSTILKKEKCEMRNVFCASRTCDNNILFNRRLIELSSVSSTTNRITAKMVFFLCSFQYLDDFYHRKRAKYLHLYKIT